MFADALRDAGFDPVWDISPLAALTRLETEPFDVVTHRSHMPGLSAASCAGRIKQFEAEPAGHRGDGVWQHRFGRRRHARRCLRLRDQPFDVDTIGWCSSAQSKITSCAPRSTPCGAWSTTRSATAR